MLKQFSNMSLLLTGTDLNWPTICTLIFEVQPPGSVQIQICEQLITNQIHKPNVIYSWFVNTNNTEE